MMNLWQSGLNLSDHEFHGQLRHQPDGLTLAIPG
jgi:hypothetical protein